MSLDNILTKLSEVEATIAGVKKAWDKVPDSINEFPCFVNYAGNGSSPVERQPQVRKVVHKIKARLYVIKADRISGEALCRPFLELFLNAIDANLDLKASCNFCTVTAYEYGVFPEWGTPYLGVSFDLEATEFDGVNFALST